MVGQRVALVSCSEAHGDVTVICAILVWLPQPGVFPDSPPLDAMFPEARVSSLPESGVLAVLVSEGGLGRRRRAMTALTRRMVNGCVIRGFPRIKGPFWESFNWGS